MKDALELRPKETALVVIDLQKGIVGMPTEPHPAAAVIANTVRIADALRRGGGQVILVHVMFAPDMEDSLKPLLDPGAPAFSGERPPDWAEIVPELSGHPEDLVVAKRQWGAFYGTDLELQLRRRNLTTLILAGISTNYGVESTARDAYERGYRMVFAEDAMSARSGIEHAHTVTRIFPRIGRVRSTAEVLAEL
jgi:nicotinamidase-related amidase